VHPAESLLTFRMNILPPSADEQETGVKAGGKQLILRPWLCKRYVLPKRQLTFNGLHGVISQKIQLSGNRGLPDIVIVLILGLYILCLLANLIEGPNHLICHLISYPLFSAALSALFTSLLT
jgi:hypothetical protein